MTFLWRSGLGKEEPDDAFLKEFGLNPKINQKPLKNFRHLIESLW